MKPSLFLAKFSLFLFLAFAFSASAYYDPGNITGFANDYAGILSTEQKQTLENKLSQFEKSSGNEIAVVIIPNLQGDTIENFAVELFRQWGIGKNGKDNGVLVLVALQDRQMKIEVGYGLEGALTDAQSIRIINDIMKPAFRANNYYQGIDEAVNKIISATNGEYTSSDNIAETTLKNASNNEGVLKSIVFVFFAFLYILSITLGRSKSYWAGGFIGAIIGGVIGFFSNSFNAGLWFAGILGIVGLIFDYLVSRVIKIRKGRNWWLGGSSGRSGGGFGGFGGGGSGGGGASGRW